MGAPQNPPQDQEEISELEKKIIQQVEYYFGNHNLRRDKFLKEQMKIDDGWVALEVMIRFNRLKSLTEDISVIVAALKKSTNDLLEVSEDETKIRRCVDKPVPEFSSETRAEIDSRTIYAKRFPPTTNLDELLQFFKGYGNVESVYMKRKPDRTFKGSVFVTYGTREEAQSFLKLENVKFANSDLLKESKEAYVKRKDSEFQERKLAKEKKQAKVKQEAKQQTAEDQSESFEKKMIRGCILKLSGLSGSTMKEHIMAIFKPLGDIAYLDYSKGQQVAFIRFSEAVAESVLEKSCKDDDGCKKITVNQVDSVASILEGEEESEYWRKLLELKSVMRHRPHFKKGKGHFNPKAGGKGKFGRRGHRRNNRDDEGAEENESEEPPRKKAKVEKQDNDSD